MGKGSFSSVWLATDLTLGDNCALKFIDLSNLNPDISLFEARIGHYLDHPHLIKIYDHEFLKIENINYALLKMEVLRGSSVALCNGRNFVPIKTAKKIIIDSLLGLECLHANNVIHNDIKPANILVDDNKNGKLSDFGLSAFCQGSTTKAKSFYKPHVAPETIGTSEVSVNSDLYQMGITMFRLINGISLIKSKFQAMSNSQFYSEVIQNGIVKNSDFLPFVPRNIRRVINKAVSVDQTRRYDSVLGMRRALERIYLKGEWTINEFGNFIGEDEKYLYSFERNQKSQNRFDLTTYRENKKSHRKTRVTKYCLKNENGSSVNLNIGSFMQDVVLGDV